VQHVRAKLKYSERRACRALGVARSTVRYIPQPREDESALTVAMTRLACQYGRYGYRRVHALLQAEGWSVSHSRVLRIWRLEGLKVPPKQPKRSRLWLADGSCIRLAPTHRNHIWSWDFVFDRTRGVCGDRAYRREGGVSTILAHGVGRNFRSQRWHTSGIAGTACCHQRMGQ
jgi:hypothetical protein